MDRKDIGNQKGIYILYTEDNDIMEKFIPNDYSPILIEPILTFENGDWHLSIPLEGLTNNYVEVFMTQETADAINQGKVQDTLLSYKPKSLIFSLIQSNAEIPVDITAIEKTDVGDVFEKTVEKMEITQEQREQLEKINNAYLKEAYSELGIK